MASDEEYDLARQVVETRHVLGRRGRPKESTPHTLPVITTKEAKQERLNKIIARKKKAPFTGPGPDIARGA